MNLESLFLILADAVANRQTSFSIGDALDVTIADVNGAPSHLTWPLALEALGAVLTNRPGSFQVGNIVLTLTKKNVPLAVPIPTTYAEGLAAYIATNGLQHLPPAVQAAAYAASPGAIAAT